MIRRWILDRGVERAVLLAQQFSRDMFRIVVGVESVGKQSPLHVPNAESAVRGRRPRALNNRPRALQELHNRGQCAASHFWIEVRLFDPRDYELLLHAHASAEGR